MSDAFIDRVKFTKVITVDKFTIDFEPKETKTVRTIPVAIQPADPEELKVDQVDWSKAYIWAYSIKELKINDEVEFCGDLYRIIKVTNAKLYNYYKAIGEEVKP
jgi:hypothetical protein